jgi:hypothetical protein
MSNDTQRTPAGLKAAGSRLWRQVSADYELDEHEEAILLEACRTRDVLTQLDARARLDGPLLDSPQGLKAHPAVVEARQQRIVLARLLTSLRLPSGDEAGRPARRPPFRGPYSVKGVAS